MRLDAAPPESHVNSGRARAGRDSGAPRVDFRGDPARWITLAERFGLLVAAGGHGSRGCYRRARTARRSAWPPASAPSTTSAHTAPASSRSSAAGPPAGCWLLPGYPGPLRARPAGRGTRHPHRQATAPAARDESGLSLGQAAFPVVPHPHPLRPVRWHAGSRWWWAHRALARQHPGQRGKPGEGWQ